MNTPAQHTLDRYNAAMSTPEGQAAYRELTNATEALTGFNDDEATRVMNLAIDSALSREQRGAYLAAVVRFQWHRVGRVTHAWHQWLRIIDQH